MQSLTKELLTAVGEQRRRVGVAGAQVEPVLRVEHPVAAVVEHQDVVPVRVGEEGVDLLHHRPHRLLEEHPHALLAEQDLSGRSRARGAAA